MSKRRIEPVDSIEITPPWDKVLEQGHKNVLERQRELFEAGIIDKDGKRIKKELPPDMQPESETLV